MRDYFKEEGKRKRASRRQGKRWKVRTSGWSREEMEMSKRPKMRNSESTLEMDQKKRS